METNLLNIKEAASYLRISTVTLYRWTYQKKIERIKIGARVLFSEDYLKEFVKNNTVNAE